MRRMTSFGCNDKSSEAFLEHNNKSNKTPFSGGKPIMIIMDIKVNNFLAFNNFHMNLAFSKEDENSLITPETFKDRPNFCYKKVAIINGSNSSGKTTFGVLLGSIFTFISKRDVTYLKSVIGNKSKDAYLSMDLIVEKYKLQRLEVKISHTKSKIELRVLETLINKDDSYYTCVDRLNQMKTEYTSDVEAALAQLSQLHWMVLPKEFNSIYKSDICKNRELFIDVLNKVMKTLDPSIVSVKDSDGNICINFYNRQLILKDDNSKVGYLLSTGTKEGITISLILSEIINNYYGFYYCDEKFSCIDSDIEISILIAMISNLAEGSQLFFTTHNKELLSLKLPKHSFYFLKKELCDYCYSISISSAEEVLNSYSKPFCDVSIYDAATNDYFSSVPETNLITDLTK